MERKEETKDGREQEAKSHLQRAYGLSLASARDQQKYRFQNQAQLRSQPTQPATDPVAMSSIVCVTNPRIRYTNQTEITKVQVRKTPKQIFNRAQTMQTCIVSTSNLEKKCDNSPAPR